jgi:hypothetical protein
MSVTIYGQHDGDAIVDVGRNDLERIPVRHIHVLSHNANSRDMGGAAYGGRWYDRDDLMALRRDLDAGALPELNTCAFTTPAGDCDNPAIHGPWCPQHADED